MENRKADPEARFALGIGSDVVDGTPIGWHARRITVWIGHGPEDAEWVCAALNAHAKREKESDSFNESIAAEFGMGKV